NDQVQILKGRSDIPRFLLGADLLIHPAYNENTGTVLLEALVSGLPVLVTDVCGYAHYIAEADAGRVLPSPFEQDSLNRLLAEMLEDAPARAA
ncbi:glycosyltransferase, partial [Acinetobacter baumannii]